MLWKRAHVLTSAGFHNLRREPRPAPRPVVELVETRSADARRSASTSPFLHNMGLIGLSTGCRRVFAWIIECQWVPVPCLP